jgi:hypothetical protein
MKKQKGWEALDLIEMVEDSYLMKRPQATANVSDLPNPMQGPLERNDEIDKQLEQLGNEWDLFNGHKRRQQIPQ